MSDENFLNMSLCDNDFGRNLEAALTAGLEVIPKQKLLHLTAWKNFVVAYVVADCLVGSVVKANCDEIAWDSLQHTERYLRNNLQVSFMRHPPAVDHDGGSACLDLNTKIAWCY